MTEYFGKDYTNIGTTSDPVWQFLGFDSGRKFDTGWVNTDGNNAIWGGATLTFSHSLGESALAAVYSIYAAEDAQGLNMEAQDFLYWHDTNSTNQPRGIQIQAITNFLITVQLAPYGFSVSTSGGYGSKFFGSSEGEFSHIRLVLIAGS